MRKETAALIYVAALLAGCAARNKNTSNQVSHPVEASVAGIKPLLAHSPQPPYPLEAKEQRLEGFVEMIIVVNATGHVVSAAAVAGDEVFVASALDSVRKWRYQPVLVNGEPIAWRSKIKLTFKLKSSPLPIEEPIPIEEPNPAFGE